MEIVEFLLKNKKTRRVRHELIRFFDTLALYIQVGYDLAYGWPETLQMLQGTISPSLKEQLLPKESEGMGSLLERISKSYENPGHRIWFGTLKDLYGSGAPLNEAVRAIGQSLRKEEEREIEAHQRALPTKINVLMLLFFLPATFILLFAPLLVQMSRVF